MKGQSSYLLQPGADLLAEDQLERELLLTDDINGGKIALRDRNYELHADERQPNDNQTLPSLSSYTEG